LPPFNTQTQMRAYKREIQKLEDVGHYYAKAMQGEIESAHVYAQINKRYCAMARLVVGLHSARSVCGSGQRTAVAA
jgi:hypothetical protein